MEALTPAIVSLYEDPEQPADPLSYVRQVIGAGERVDIDRRVGGQGCRCRPGQIVNRNEVIIEKVEKGKRRCARRLGPSL
jgi:hypothetical protein